MDGSMEEDQQNSIKFIRKLRKKLRQIERLEKAQRDLTEEERIKLSCKHDLREKLQSILSTLNDSEISLDSNERGSVPPADEDQDQVDDYDDEEDDEDISTPEVVACKETETDDVHYTAVERKDTILEVDTTSPILISEDTKKKFKKLQSQNVKSALRRSWRNTRCHIVELKGHNDYVSCTDASEEWIVSGSRDTTVKLWSCLSGKELKNMGGHTGQVTAVRIIDEPCSNDLRSKMDLSTVEVFTDITQVNSRNERIVLSGSTDCSVRLWIIPSGLFVKSIYNYNPVSSLEFFRSKKYVLVGSSSGNFTVYDICSSSQIYSSVVHSNLITTIKVHNERIITSSADGSIKVWNIKSTKEDDNQQCKKPKFSVTSQDFDLRIQYSFDMHDAYTPHRHVYSFDCHGSEICFGDDGCNIKFWDPSSGEYMKLRNHRPGVPGITDGISVENDLLLCSSYDMDRGNGSINLRSLKKECHKEFIASFYDEDTPRLATLTTFFSENLKYMVTGGEKLLIWHLRNADSSSAAGDSAQEKTIISGRKVVGLARPVVHSDASSDEETSTDDETKWFWQKVKQPEMDSVENDDESSTTDSEKTEEEFSKNKPPDSICNWCTVI